MTRLPPTVRERIPLPALAQRPAGDVSTAPSPAEFIAMLRRRIVLTFFLFAVFSGMAVGGWLVWAKVYPGFRSEALIECISNIPEAEMSVEQRRLKQDEHARFVMTQAVLLKAPAVLQEALKVAAVRETSWFKRIDPDERLLELTEQLSAAPVRGTNFLRVAIQCRDPRDPKVIVNEVVARWHDSVPQRPQPVHAALDPRGYPWHPRPLPAVPVTALLPPLVGFRRQRVQGSPALGYAHEPFNERWI